MSGLAFLATVAAVIAVAAVVQMLALYSQNDHLRRRLDLSRRTSARLRFERDRAINGVKRPCSLADWQCRAIEAYVGPKLAPDHAGATHGAGGGR